MHEKAANETIHGYKYKSANRKAQNGEIMTTFHPQNTAANYAKIIMSKSMRAEGLRGQRENHTHTNSRTHTYAHSNCSPPYSVCVHPMANHLRSQLQGIAPNTHTGTYVFMDAHHVCRSGQMCSTFKDIWKKLGNCYVELKFLYFTDQHTQSEMFYCSKWSCGSEVVWEKRRPTYVLILPKKVLRSWQNVKD